MKRKPQPGVRLQCGAARFRVRRRIQEHLDHLGLDQADVARLAGVNKSLVTATISGSKHSPKVLEALRKLEVPEKYLHDPVLKAAEVEELVA